MWKYCIAILFLFPVLLYAGEFPVDADCLPIVTIAESRNNICLDSAVTFRATISNNGANGVYKWKKNELDAGINSPDYTAADLRDDDVVTLEYTCQTVCGTEATVVSNAITVHVINDITPVIIIANNDPLICEGELTLFTSQAYYGNAIPFYEWFVNGIPVGSTGPDYVTDSLTNGSKVECVLTITTPGCPGVSGSSTSSMTIYVYPMIHPTIKITPDKTDICRGEQVTFTATANGGAYPSFEWKINGKPTGDVSPGFVSNTLKDGDSVSCTVTIDQDSRCHTTTSSPSNKVVIHVRDYTDPGITIAAPLAEACAGKPLSFTATPKNAGDHTSYQWHINDNSAGSYSPVFVTGNLKNGDRVSCVLTTSIPGCSFTATVSSDHIAVTIRDTPVIIFSPPDISVLSGEPAQLNASVTGSISSLIWKPAEALLTPDSLVTYTQPLGQSTVFTLMITDINGCVASGDLPVKVLYRMHMPSAFTPNKDGKNDLFRIPPGSSVLLEQFSVFDRWGNIIFKTADISKGWDGTYRGLDLATGTYIYLIKGTLMGKEVIGKGTVTLIR